MRIMEADEAIYEKMSLAPQQPGVYIFSDNKGEVLYIGKAANLHNRVKAYFTPSPDARPFINFLKPRIKRMEFMLTDTEKEALLLENNLIKKYKPRYNIRLKDDKTYVNIRISAKHEFPGIQIVRRPVKKGFLIFGPYSSAYAARETVKLITSLFMMRTCSDAELKNRIRPCLKFQIKRCSAPCVNLITHENYAAFVRQARLFLDGRTSTILKELKTRMKAEARDEHYERAAQIRDLIFNIEKTVEQQKVEIAKNIDIDVFNLSYQGTAVVVNGLFIRRGQLLNSLNYMFKDTVLDHKELMNSMISQYYERGHFIPDVIYLPFKLPDIRLIRSRLSELKGKDIGIITPTGGKKVKLLNLSLKNAVEYLQMSLHKEAASLSAVNLLKKILRLKNFPIAIECFDNSNITGTNNVSSMIRFENGTPVKSKYRHYRLKEVHGHDDYAMMREVLTRRFKNNEDIPSLIIVDGGKGQLNVALSVVKKPGIDQPDVIGIAKLHREDVRQSGNKNRINKEEDRIYIPNRKEPLMLAHGSEPLMLLKRIRDEAHRFAITYHRKLRTKAGLASELDGITGISEKRKRLLLSIFGSIEEIKNASPEEMLKRTGLPISAAREIYKYFH